MREAIVEYTGVAIGTNARNGAERLRQFVDGLRRTKAPYGRKFPLPKPAALEAIVAFVTHEELNLLTVDELNGYVPQFQSLLRWLEYLNDGSETARLIPPENLQGLYKISGFRNSLHFIRKLRLRKSETQGLIHVAETEDRYGEGSDGKKFDKWTKLERRKVHKSRERHGGWAILTPEDNLLFFMKNEENARNRYYMTMAADVGLWSGAPHNQLVVLQHDYPFELEQGEVDRPDIEKKVIHEIREKMLFFNKEE